MNNQSKIQTFPPQHQSQQPGIESEMIPAPVFESSSYKASGKLQDKVAIITGGDSGIGRAVALLMAKEGANIVISYLSEHEDAQLTKSLIEKEGKKCILLPGDIGDESHCKEIVNKAVTHFGKLNILVNNAAEQHPQQKIENITSQQLEKTFRTNIFSYFYLTKAALPYLQKQLGSTIINTASVTAYKGNPTLIDYSATKGAVVSFTRSLSASIIKQGIRVNAVAPGPIWTPLIPSTFTSEQVASFGANTPMKRAGQPIDIAPAYVYLASEDSSYMTGQVLHINGGEIVNS